MQFGHRCVCENGMRMPMSSVSCIMSNSGQVINGCPQFITGNKMNASMNGWMRCFSTSTILSSSSSFLPSHIHYVLIVPACSWAGLAPSVHFSYLLLFIKHTHTHWPVCLWGAKCSNSKGESGHGNAYNRYCNVWICVTVTLEPETKAVFVRDNSYFIKRGRGKSCAVFSMFSIPTSHPPPHHITHTHIASWLSDDQSFTLTS